MSVVPASRVTICVLLVASLAQLVSGEGCGNGTFAPGNSSSSSFNSSTLEALPLAVPSSIRKLQVQSPITKLAVYLRSSGTYSKVYSLMAKSQPGEASFFDYLRTITSIRKITLLVPTNAAWYKLNSRIRNQVQSSALRDLKTFLRFYVINSRLTASTLASSRQGATFFTAEGSLLEKVNRDRSIVLGPPDGSSSNRATVIHGDAWSATPIVCHIVDTFIVPPDW